MTLTGETEVLAPLSHRNFVGHKSHTDWPGRDGMLTSVASLLSDAQIY